MLLAHGGRSKKRRGAAVVEMAIVSGILMMLLFGILEYCRFLFILHVTNNAARDAARYAAVHTNGGNMPNDPTTIAQSDLVNLVTTGTIGSQTVGPGMAGMQQNINGYAVQIFSADATGLAQNPALAKPAASSGGLWNAAVYGQPIAVTVSGSYQPVLPSFFFLPASIPVQVTVMVGSEAN